MTYDWKKTGKKFLIALVEILIAGGLAYVTARPELLFLMPFLEAARNYWKNR